MTLLKHKNEYEFSKVCYSLAHEPPSTKTPKISQYLITQDLLSELQVIPKQKELFL